MAQDRNAASFHLVAVDDCGVPAGEARLVEGRNGEIAASLAPMATAKEGTISTGLPLNASPPVAPD
jgi:hypothetical protein